jgi:hypothetical protein
MKNSENPKFEESWKDAFLDAESNPPDSVWNNIDLHLSKEEGGNMKRRVVFYQRLAAASVLFALLLGGTGVWYWFDTDRSLASNPTKLDEKNVSTASDDFEAAPGKAQEGSASNEIPSTGTAKATADLQRPDSSLGKLKKDETNVALSTNSITSTDNLKEEKSIWGLKKDVTTSVPSTNGIASTDNLKKENSLLAQLKKDGTTGVLSTNSIASTDNSRGMTSSLSKLKKDEPAGIENTVKNGVDRTDGGDRALHQAVVTTMGKSEANRSGNNQRIGFNDGLADSTVGHYVQLASNQLPSAVIKLNGKPVEEIMGAKRFLKPAIADSKNKLEDDKHRGWWASVGGSAGSYNPQTSGSNSLLQSSQISAGPNSLLAPMSNQASMGTSYSFGVNVGRKIAKRWVLITGVNYLNQSIGYNSNIAMFDQSNQARAFLADAAFTSEIQSSNLTVTTPYAINSVNEFVSVPVQAGYMLINRKIGLQLNAGVSSDFFVKNTLADQSGRLSSSTQSAGNNSTYRTLNWAGLAGTELSYNVTKHYRVSIIPGLRYGLNSVLKTSDASSNPLVWDVGFRFRYIFK